MTRNIPVSDLPVRVGRWTIDIDAEAGSLTLGDGTVVLNIGDDGVDVLTPDGDYIDGARLP